MARTQVGSPTTFSDNGSASTIVFAARDIAPGSLIAVALRTEMYEADVDITITDSERPAVEYTVEKRVEGSTVVAAGLIHNHPGGDDVVITVSFSESQEYRRGAVLELTGGDASNPFQVGSVVKSGGTALALDHSVPFTPNASILSVQGCYNSTTITPDTGTSIDGDALWRMTLISDASTSPANPKNTGAAGSTANLSFAFSEPGGEPEPEPPVLSSPTGTKTGHNSASGTVSTDKSGGTLRYLATTNASESASTIKSSGASQAVSATGTQNVTFSSLTPSTGYYAHYVQVHDDGDSNVVSSSQFTTDAAPDTTPPTLTGSITEVSKTSTSISISWPAGSDNVAVVGYDVSSNGGSSWTSLGNVLAHEFTSLTPSTEYQIRVRARDAADNTSTPPLSIAITTSAADDTTNPTFTGSVSVSERTVSSVRLTWAAGSDNVGVVGYDLRIDGGAWANLGNVLTYVPTGLDDDTEYDFEVAARDAAGNRGISPVATASTYPLGASGEWLLDHPASFMSQCVDEGDEDDWFWWELVSGPASGSWEDGPYPNGTGSFEGPNHTSMQIRLWRGNGGAPVDEGVFTVYLYDDTVSVTPANSVSGATVSASSAVQTYRATPANANSGATVSASSAIQAQAVTPADSVSGATVSPSSAVQTFRATPADCVSGATVSSAAATQPEAPTHQAVPADSVSGATVSASEATQIQIALPADSISGATVSASAATQTQIALPADSVSGSTVSSTRAIQLTKARAAAWAKYPMRGQFVYPPR